MNTRMELRSQAGLFIIILQVLLHAIPSCAWIDYVNSLSGLRLCKQIPKNLRQCQSGTSGYLQPLFDYYRSLYPNRTSTAISIQNNFGGFTVRFQSGKVYRNIEHLIIINENSEVEIEVKESSQEFQITCAGFGSFIKFSSNSDTWLKKKLKFRFGSGYPVLDMYSTLKMRAPANKFQPGHVTCGSVDGRSSETLQIFTQSPSNNDISPFATMNELPIKSDGTTYGFIIPCTTNYRMETPPKLLWKNNTGDFYNELRRKEIETSFTWNSGKGFQFNSSDGIREMGFFRCEFNYFTQSFFPTITRFKREILIKAENNKLSCGLRSKPDSTYALVDANITNGNLLLFACDSYTKCGLELDLGEYLDDPDNYLYYWSENATGNVLPDRSGIVHCSVIHDYKTIILEEKSMMFFIGFDSNVYLLPGLYPNSSVIQFTEVYERLYKAQTDLYYEFTCKVINFIKSEETFLVLRRKDLSKTDPKRDGRSKRSALSFETRFNVSLDTNMTHAICFHFTTDGKLVSAETPLEILDAFAPLVQNATNNSRTFQVGELNDDLSLVCPITGAPPPEYRWTFDQQVADLIDGVKTKILTFRQIHKTIAGNYICTAWNQYGGQSYDFQVNVQSPDPQITGQTELGKSTIGWISFGVILCFVLFCSVVVLACKYIKAKREIRNLTPEEALEFLNGTQVTDGSSNAYGSELAVHLPFTKCIESTALNVVRDKILGKGEYGIVYHGTYLAEAVAVKTFKRAVTYEEFRAGLVEVKLMNFVGDHKNIVKFIGADVTNIEKRDILIVMELSPIGSLEKYLRTLNPSIQTHYVMTTMSQYTSCDERMLLGTLFGFCEQIALGMEHLESKKVIHGDLAARNVLVFSHGVVKVTDFGYSRQLYESEMYKPKKIRALPWRWSSIELLRQMEFSTESDIWAFGVTVWEILTFGNVPFASEKWSEQFMESLENGLRLKKPSIVTQSQYTFLKECWNLNKSARPRFSELRSFFSKEQEDLRQLVVTSV